MNNALVVLNDPVPIVKKKGWTIIKETGPWTIIKTNEGRPRKGKGRVRHIVRWFDIYQDGARVAQISTGNQKIANTVIFSLPTHSTCPGMTKLCAWGCYANVRYPLAVKNRIMNYNFSLTGRFGEGMRIAIEAIGDKYGIDRVRIHEAGDFYGPEYWQEWVDVMINLPNFKFWAYTKSPVLDWSVTPGYAPRNIVLRASTDRSSLTTWAESKWRPGPEAYMLDTDNEPVPSKKEAYAAGFVYCPATQGSQKVTCGDCNICFDTTLGVIFPVHGSQRLGNYPDFHQEYDRGVC